MRKRHCEGNYRHFKTTQERRAYFAHKEYVRGKRSARSIPSSYDDLQNRSWHMRKSWKEKRTTQYRVGGRGKMFVFEFGFDVHIWDVEDYLKEQDIPYRAEAIKETRRGYRWDGWPYAYSVCVGYKVTYWAERPVQFPKQIYRE